MSIAPRRVAMLGMGGLGCPAALALVEESRARQIPLELLLVDDDRVDLSNLARQTLYGPSDVGEWKVHAATRALQKLVPDAPVEVVPCVARFDESTVDNILNGVFLILDGTDSFETRFFANDRALAANLPLVHGAALGWIGQLTSILPGGPCLRCLFEGPPPPGSVPACRDAGVIGPLCALVGAAMASEAMALLSGEPLRARGTLLRWDALAGTSRAIPIPRDPVCPACALSQTEQTSS